MLSVCITVKNRSRLFIADRELHLFPNCVRSLVESVDESIRCELVVTDWNSDDWPLVEWLKETASPIPVCIITLEGTFSRGRGLNVAARAARGDCLFFLDADALVCKQVIQDGIQHVRQGKAYFPILYSFNEPDHRTGRWRRAGFGHCILSKQTFNEVGGWPEYTSWGKEDDHFWTTVGEKIPVVREEVNGFYHQWHPDDLDFKNQYGEETHVILRIRARAEETERAHQAVVRLRTILPNDACYILVDEDRFETKGHAGNKVLPFLERDGQYWGPPADDAQAIYELDRLRRGGASFIVFPWTTFWWLEYYDRFAEHLRKTARCMLQDDQLAVYDLRRTQDSISVKTPVDQRQGLIVNGRQD